MSPESGELGNTTCGNRARIDAVDSNAMGLAQLFGPDSCKRFVSSFCRGVHCLTSDAQAGSSGRDENDSPALGQIRLNGFGEEDGSLDVGLEMGVVVFLCGVDQVRFGSESSAGKRSVTLKVVRTHISILMNKNIDPAGAAELQSSFDKFGNVVRYAEISLASYGFAAMGLDLIHNFLGLPKTAVRGVIDDYVGATFAEKACDGSSNATVLHVSTAPKSSD